MKSALLIVDMQNDFVLPTAPACVAGALATVPRVREVLDCFRSGKLPVFHVYREYRADGSDIEITRRPAFMAGARFVVPGTPGAEFVRELEPVAGEYRIVKRCFSAFFATELDLVLRRLGVDRILLCGTQYPHCIRATAYDAISHGYPVTVVTDATSAATPEVAAANIRDMESIGIRCAAFADVRRDLEGTPLARAV
ncbi:MAG TPA: isochorismatase family cysteine hydrolase [Steroidobacteraceae bacterium]|jgi:nicotinamidase-related amidase|nr:isochorismatase family cysteine hydrolase [Steroidobacteraceae bacterium]